MHYVTGHGSRMRVGAVLLLPSEEAQHREAAKAARARARCSWMSAWLGLCTLPERGDPA